MLNLALSSLILKINMGKMVRKIYLNANKNINILSELTTMQRLKYKIMFYGAFRRT